MLLTFDFKTVEEAKEFLAGLKANPQRGATPNEFPVPAGQTSISQMSPPFPPAAAVVHPAPDVTAIVEPNKNKPGRPKKAVVIAVGDGASTTFSIPGKQKEYGIEDCRTALSNLFDTKGREAAKAALAEFKAARVTDLKADQYRGFVVLCETLGQPE